jgi:hypothetical protein
MMGAIFFKDQEEERKEIVANNYSSELWTQRHSNFHILK